MKILVLFFYHFLFLIVKSQTQAEEQDLLKNKKNILVYTFPGGKSHCFIFLELIQTTLLKLSRERPETEYNFHVIVHNYDYQQWSRFQSKNYILYTFGSVEEYEQKFNIAMQKAKDDPIFGYKQFNDAMMFLNNEFLQSKTLETLQKSGIKFDLIISDVVNLISPFLRRELNIDKMIYVNPTCIYTWVIPNMEYNAAYEPVLGTTFNDKMSFFERLSNTIIKKGTEIMYLNFKKAQNKIFIQNGYEPIDPFQPNSLFMNQCVNGIHYSTSLPPNFIPAGAFLPKEAKPIKEDDLNTFLDKFDICIYVSQGTITKAMNIKQIIEIFKAFPQIGFVFSIRKDMNVDKSILPSNVLAKFWVPQNDLLGSKKIKAFITHGGLNSILESIYHGVPMIVLGTSIDQVNSAALVQERGYGLSFTKERDIKINTLIKAIKEILMNDTYKENVMKGSSLVKENNGKETFYYWFNYVLENGYEHLLIPAVLNYSSYELFNFDILVMTSIFCIIIFVGFSYGITRIYSTVVL